ncbi:MAG TPA: PilZ domain-containing protein [Terriglobales bacterium]|jgi:hypothetical protein
MSKTKPAKAADWTRLLADPDLASHLAQLLQICRDSTPEKREKALFDAIREIKSKGGTKAKEASASEAASQPLTSATETAPPFEPDIFTPSWGEDRRRYPRLKCFVAVELHVDGMERPAWGNLSNISLGGCLVETPAFVEAGKTVQIGLWVTSGNLWVKGLVLVGTVASKTPTTGFRVKFAEMEVSARETLRMFLKYVEGTTKNYNTEHGYLAQLKG